MGLQRERAVLGESHKTGQNRKWVFSQYLPIFRVGIDPPFLFGPSDAPLVFGQTIVTYVPTHQRVTLFHRNTPISGLVARQISTWFA